MPDMTKHDVKITEIVNDKYPFLVTCGTCSWQAHATDQHQADRFKASHESNAMWLQATKGFQRGHL